MHCLKSFWFSSSESAAGWPEAKRSSTFFSSGISSLRTNFFTSSRSIRCSSLTWYMPLSSAYGFPMPLFTKSSVYARPTSRPAGSTPTSTLER